MRAFRRTFEEAAPRGRFGIWRLCPPNPALAGNACRWAAWAFSFAPFLKVGSPAGLFRPQALSYLVACPNRLKPAITQRNFALCQPAPCPGSDCSLPFWKALVFGPQAHLAQVSQLRGGAWRNQCLLSVAPGLPVCYSVLRFGWFGAPCLPVSPLSGVFGVW